MKDSSSFLKIELERVSKETGIISDVRGYGTHLAFDAETADSADLLQRWLLRSGINVLKCGPQTFGLRPSLDLRIDDAAHLRESLLHFHPEFEQRLKK